MLAKIALLFFGIALWHKGLSFYGYYLLPVAWVLDGGLRRFRQTLNEPFVIGMLVLCFVLALGILWSDDPKLGFKVWRRYFAFLVFIPYLSLLNKERLPWAIGGLLAGYLGVLLTGIHQWIIMNTQGIPTLRLTYLDFSAMLGIGIILTLYLADISKNKKTKSLLWFLAILLLFIQFNQNARGILIATLISSGLLLLLLHKKEIRTLLTVMASLIIVIAVFAYTSTSFHERMAQAEHDIELSKLGQYDTSLGYRLALWDVGLHGIAERPLLGRGTGMAGSYFDKTIETYKSGLYKELLKFSPIYHYHNDWIEVGMHLGALGLAAYAFFLQSWFRTLRIHRLTPLGAAFMCFIVLLGLTDVFVIFRQNLYLILIITAIGVTWQKAYGLTSVQTENYPV
ncbi:O-antigen ligase [Nitrosovibrio sp. Nv4]|nr:O-antigen ligase [Nitrosovibrio sp. Nv4]